MTELLPEIERLVIQIAITASRGNIQAAARALGMNRTTLHMRLKKYGIESDKVAEKSPTPADHLRIKPPGFSRSSAITLLKCEMCYNALVKCDWNRSKAAKECRVSLRFMRYMVHTLRFAGYDVPAIDSRGRII